MKRSVCVLFAFLCMVSPLYASRADVARVEQAFMEGRYDASAADAQRLINAHAGYSDELYYLKGLSELKLARYDAARESFRYIETKYPDSYKAFDARLGIGDSYMLAGDLSSAVGIYIGMLDAFRSNRNLPAVYSRLASCYKGLGVKDKAEYYKNMAQQAAPLSFEAKGQGVNAAPAAPAARAVAAAPAPKLPAPQSAVPVTNIRMKDDAEVDVMMADSSSGKLSVQVGSFKNRKNAEKLAQKLASSGYESRVEIPVSGLDKLYRVKVGRVSSRAEAQAIAARLTAAGYTTKLCDGE